MSFNSGGPSDKQTTPEQISAAVKYLRQGWDAQAFLVLSESGTEKNPVARFALGLCYLRANDLTMAAQCFEQALNLLKAASAATPATAVMKGTSENSETHVKLTEKQIEDKVYLTPMDPDFCARFPKAAEQIAILALIDVYQRKGMNEQAQRLSSGLTGPAFESFKKRLGSS